MNKSNWGELEKKALFDESLAIELDFAKARVLDEYLLMSEDWILVGNNDLDIISNNFSNSIYENVITPIEKQVKVQNTVQDIDCKEDKSLPFLFDPNASDSIIIPATSAVSLYEMGQYICPEELSEIDDIPNHLLDLNANFIENESLSKIVQKVQALKKQLKTHLKGSFRELSCSNPVRFPSFKSKKSSQSKQKASKEMLVLLANFRL